MIASIGYVASETSRKGILSYILTCLDFVGTLLAGLPAPTTGDHLIETVTWRS